MADFADELRTYLKTVSDITSIIGTGADARIYHDTARQGAPLPYIVLVEAGPGQSVELLEDNAGIVQAVFHVYCYGTSRVNANNLFEQVRANLDTFVGVMGTTRVDGAHISGYRDAGIDRPNDGSEVVKPWMRGVFHIWHEVPPVKV